MAPAGPDPEPQWPPRSPREALLSTPGGRRRYREMLNRTSPSPSPSKRSRPSPSVASRMAQLADDDMDLDEDDDEETLQLKLQEIQARLRLKQLQNARAKGSASAASQRPLDGGDLRSDSATSTYGRRRTGREATPGEDEAKERRPLESVQVPASPVRKLQAPQLQTSPSRVLLGIDKGLRGKDVSLKRVSSNKRPQGGSSSAQGGGYLEKSRSANLSAAPSEPSRPQSFNEKLASVRSEETFRAERQEKIQKLRTNAFGIGRDEMEEYKKSAVDIPDEPIRAPTFTRDEILSKGKGKSTAEGIPRSKTAPGFRSNFDENESSTATAEDVSKDWPLGDADDEQASSFDPYSSLHLSRRILPHRVLARHVSGKKVLNIKDLLKEVKAPDFSLPDVEQDIVVFAIVAKKSEPRSHKPTVAKNGLKSEDRGKYIVMTLVDLDFELDLFLFNSGFSRFWKLTEGTVVAILNPNVMPPPPGRQDTGRFSLVINSEEDTILEIGSARDLGFCKSVKKDGDMCGAWINKKRTEFCEFHANEAVRKQRSTRVEINSSGFGEREKGHKKGPGGARGAGGEYEGKTKNKNYDWDARSQFFLSRSHSTADLIDGKDRAPSDRKEKAEFLKRGMEAKEKEREMMKKLGQIGDAAGREYMQRAGSKAANVRSSLAPSQTPDSVAPGNGSGKAFSSLGNKDRDIHLSPLKRKRPDNMLAESATSSGRSGAAFGWGSSLSDKLSNMKEGGKLRKDEERPVRKKTRFVTEKGIRVAGRESLGMDLSERQVSLDDDDDDELVIVK